MINALKSALLHIELLLITNVKNVNYLLIVNYVNLIKMNVLHVILKLLLLINIL